MASGTRSPEKRARDRSGGVGTGDWFDDFIDSCKTGDEARAALRLAEAQAAVDDYISVIEGPLRACCEAGHATCARLLLAAKAGVDSSFFPGKGTPLLVACATDQI